MQSFQAATLHSSLTTPLWPSVVIVLWVVNTVWLVVPWGTRKSVWAVKVDLVLHCNVLNTHSCSWKINHADFSNTITRLMRSNFQCFENYWLDRCEICSIQSRMNYPCLQLFCFPDRANFEIPLASLVFYKKNPVTKRVTFWTDLNLFPWQCCHVGPVTLSTFWAGFRYLPLKTYGNTKGILMTLMMIGVFM